MLAPVLVVHGEHLLLEKVCVDVGWIIGFPVSYVFRFVRRAGTGEAGVEDAVATVFGALR